MQSGISLKAVKGNINMIDDHLIHTRMLGFATFTVINYLAKAYLTLGELCERTSTHDGPLDTQGLPCKCRYHILRFNKSHRILSLLYCIDGCNRNIIIAVVYKTWVSVKHLEWGFLWNLLALRQRYQTSKFGFDMVIYICIYIYIWYSWICWRNFLYPYGILTWPTLICRGAGTNNLQE